MPDNLALAVVRSDRTREVCFSLIVNKQQYVINQWLPKSGTQITNNVHHLHCYFHNTLIEIVNRPFFTSFLNITFKSLSCFKFIALKVSFNHARSLLWQNKDECILFNRFLINNSFGFVLFCLVQYKNKLIYG